MKPLALVQARWGSTRLPGKVWLPIEGKPMLTCLTDRLGTLDWYAVWPYHDLPEGDVLGRFARFLAHIDPYGVLWDPIIRLTADCPMLDVGVLNLVVGTYLNVVREEAYDLVGTSPAWDGLDVEVISRAALARAHERAVEPYDREHVTPWTKRHGRYLEIPLEGPALRWSVDDQEGLDFVREVFRLCEHCREGVPRHTNASGSIGGADRQPRWDLHMLPAGDLGECTAHTTLMSRTGGTPYVSP